MLVEQLRQEWRARRAPQNFQEALCFKAERLELGAGTVLAKTDAGGAHSDQRLTALLSVAYGPTVAANALGHVRAAIARRKAGDAAAADLHLALSRLNRLRRPEDASRRLFMADGLMRGGVSPDAIMEVLWEAASEGANLVKYSPDQPRVPAGSGRASGEWTSGDASTAPQPTKPASAPQPKVEQTSRPASSGSDDTSPKAPDVVSAPSAQAATGDGVDAAYVSPAAYAAPVGAAPAFATIGRAALKRMFEFVIGLASPEVAAAVAFAGALAIPSRGPKGRWVYVGGPGNVSYYQNPDETRLILKFSTQGGQQHTVNLTPDQNGDRDPDGNILACTLKAAAKTGIVVSTAELLGEQPGQPQLCPKPKMGRNQGPYGKAYEAYMKARLNDPPTPPDLAYYLRDPVSGNLVEFDDCDWDKPGLHEYKGPRYQKHMDADDFIWNEVMVPDIEKKFLAQVRAAGGAPLTWSFAEKPVADYFRERFGTWREGRENIDVKYEPMPGRAK